MTRSITFLRGWQGRLPGSSDSRLPLGVMTTLVQFGHAKWADDDTSQQGKPERPERRRKRR
jgi:hypothetical protein